MQAYRKIIDGQRLNAVVNLPSELKYRKVEIIILPAGERKKKKKKLSQNWANSLSDFRSQYTSLELQKKALEWRES
ncbi:MAG: hypothetical protein QG657_5574 [Acidobacteriota bacterium]|nr:hypothetical protein [Acidobacteriota bacterium]